MKWRDGAAEAGLFLVASAIGIYGLGEGLSGFFTPQHGSALWLILSAVALAVLAKQMARVQDHWPPHAARPPIGPDAGPAPGTASDARSASTTRRPRNRLGEGSR